jgi:hypothetical protein
MSDGTGMVIVLSSWQVIGFNSMHIKIIVLSLNAEGNLKGLPSPHGDSGTFWDTISGSERFLYLSLHIED